MKFINNNSFVIIIGSNKSGKSFITKDLLYHHSNSLSNYQTYYQTNSLSGIAISKKDIDYIPPIFIYETIDKKLIKKFIKNLNKNVDCESFIILDSYSKYLDKLFDPVNNLHKICNPSQPSNIQLSNIRPLNIQSRLSCLVVLELDYIDNIFDYGQDLKKKSPKKNINLKKSLEYLFILKENLYANRKKIYDNFLINLGFEIEFTLFCKLLDDYTEDYNFIVIYLKSESKNICDKIFWYRSDKHDNLKICSDEAWNYNQENLIIEPNNKTDFNTKIYDRNINFNI